MDPFKAEKTKRNGPERIIQNALVKMFKLKDWGVKETHGNIYQFGFPDLYVFHKSYGTRWVEVKNPLAYSFTPAQLETFHEFASKGVGIWILTAASEAEYQKLFRPANWIFFLPTMKV